MDCLRPKLIRNPVFKSKRWKVDTEYRLLHQDEDEYVLRPCGKCLNCMKKRQNEWAFRIQSEAKEHFGRTFFVTLTFDDDHLHNYYHIQVPSWIQKFQTEFRKTGDVALLDAYEHYKSKFVKSLKRKCVVSKNSVKLFTCAPSIDKKDLQDFHKRLRESGLKFSFFACGEYGDKFSRPHYHVIYFLDSGQDYNFETFHDRIYPYWNMCIPEELKVSSIDTMVNGIPASKYVAKYSVKRVGFNYKDCLPPFALQSKDHPIGVSYLNVDNYKQLRTNFSLLVKDDQGTPYALPRFYRNKVFSESERKQLSVASQTQKMQYDLLQARLKGIDIDLFHQKQLIHNLYIEKQYFAKLKLSRFGYDFEVLCSPTETI